MRESGWPNAARKKRKWWRPFHKAVRSRRSWGRTGFRRNFPFGAKWRGKYYANKQVIAYAVRERRGWLVITVITKFF